jgi:hypothetical protein
MAALQHAGIKPSAFILSESKKTDFSSRTNLDVIKKWGNGVNRLKVFRVPFLGDQAGSLRGIARAEKKLKKVLAGIWECI